MTLVQIRKKVKKSVDSADEKLLVKLLKIVEREENKVLGYTVAGAPVTRAVAKKELEKAEKDIRNGNYVANGELKKRMA
jgi:hypothetical protein